MIAAALVIGGLLCIGFAALASSPPLVVSGVALIVAGQRLRIGHA